MLAHERQTKILDLLAQQESASLADILAVSEASEATARRDLASLAQRGLLKRTRGGALVLRRDTSLDEEFSRRRRHHARAKRLMAAAAADLVADGATLFLNDGSTTFALAEELLRRELNILVATSALNIAELLASNPAVEVIVIGGSLRQARFGTIGPLATNAIATIHAEIAFLGCDGLSTSGVKSNTVYDAEVARVMATHAERVVVMADSSKLRSPAPAAILDWGDVDVVVTDVMPVHIEQALTLRGVVSKQVGKGHAGSPGSSH